MSAWQLLEVHWVSASISLRRPVPVLVAAHESAELSGLRVHQVSASINLRRLASVAPRLPGGTPTGWAIYALFLCALSSSSTSGLLATSITSVEVVESPFSRSVMLSHTLSMLFLICSFAHLLFLTVAS